MSQRFAVKLGEVHLVADRPITEKEREAAAREVKCAMIWGADDLTAMYAEFRPSTPQLP
jgi:hypothetical protein